MLVTFTLFSSDTHTSLQEKKTDNYNKTEKNLIFRYIILDVLISILLT